MSGTASQAYTLSCPGVVSTGSDGSALCTDASTGAPVAWVSVPPFDVSQLDYGECGQAFAAAFVIVGMCWGLGKAVGTILRMVGR